MGEMKVWAELPQNKKIILVLKNVLFPFVVFFEKLKKLRVINGIYEIKKERFF